MSYENFEMIDKLIGHRLARMRVEGKNSPDLPQGAKRFRDHEANNLFAKAQINAIRYYQETGRSKSDASVLESLVVRLGYQFEEMKITNLAEPHNTIHPTVEGYYWYRGYRIAIPEQGQVYLFKPWLQPWRRGGAPDAIVYTEGNVQREKVLEIVRLYSDASTRQKLT